MTQLMFYQRPVALNRDRHQGLKLTVVPDHFKFAGHTNAGEADGPLSAVALVGLRDQENLMVTADGQWTPGAYIPAFARRYPFVLAKTEDQERLTVCIDEVYPGLGTHEGQALFDDAGAETDYLKQILDFLQRFHAEAQRTTEFAHRLRELGLLVPKVIQVEREGQVQSLQGLWVVDMARYQGIDDARVAELFRLGYVSWIEAHLLSLGSLGQLVSRMAPQPAATATASASAKPSTAQADEADDGPAPDLPGSEPLRKDEPPIKH
jgi:hypothetical protein